MNAMFGLLVPALLGVDFGWQRKTDGTIEYIVQVDAESFAEMQRSGREFGSAVPAALRDRISDLTFRVGDAALPNQNTLPPAEKPAAKSDDGEGPKRVTTYYPPNNVSTSTGAATWPSSAPNSTTANWPATASPPSGTPSWPSNTTPLNSAPLNSGVPLNSGSNQPVSTSGFPINPTAPAPISNSPTTAAWPSSTSPPSLSGGPQIPQPPSWQTPPREVTISAKPPLDPGPPTGAAGGNTPTYNNGGYNGPNYAQGGYGPQPQPLQPGQQYSQASYPPPNTQPQGQYAPQQNVAPSPQNDPYYNRPREPASPNDRAVVNTAPTSTANDSQWLSFTIVFLLLIVSGSCNLYFGWTSYQLRERFRLLMVDRSAI